MAFPVYFSGHTHVGNFRKNNEDYVLAGPVGAPVAQTGDVTGELSSDEGGCFVIVCDGLGGSTSGEVASEQAAHATYQSLCRLYAENPAADPRETLRAALVEAHLQVLNTARQQPEHDGMASTASCIWCMGGNIHLGQVGDSRVYRFQARTLRQLSMDQSPVGKLMLSGRISEAEARQHPLKNYVDEVLGGAKRMPSPQTDTFPVKQGDIFLLCSDGLSDSLDDDALAHIVDTHLAGGPKGIAAELLRKALARAGRDNVSLIVLRAGVRDGNRAAHRLLRMFSSSPSIERLRIDDGQTRTVRFHTGSR